MDYYCGAVGLLLSWQKWFKRVVTILLVLMWTLVVYKLGYRSGYVSALEEIIAGAGQHTPPTPSTL